MPNYRLIPADQAANRDAPTTDLYPYRVYTGRQSVNVEPGHSVWVLSKNPYEVSARGIWLPETMGCDGLIVVIQGYRPPYRAAAIDAPRLPYINGCSTAQLLPPIRPGDPTWQMLYMPPNTSEQQHHIHSTARVVYVQEGEGTSVIGQGAAAVNVPLQPGATLILDPMVPHHFYTGSKPLVVLPLHVFSTPALNEHHHPMMAGTHLISQNEGA